MNVEGEKSDNIKSKKDELPFAVFVCPKNQNKDIIDYKQVFTDIISERIQGKYK